MRKNTKNAVDAKDGVRVRANVVGARMRKMRLALSSVSECAKIWLALECAEKRKCGWR